MSFDALEVSAQSGQPVELYRFVVGGDDAFPIAPPPPGRLFRVLSLAPGIWTMERDTGQTSVGTCPPTSPDSAICGAYPEFGFQTGLTVWGAFHGPIGGANSHFYARFDLSGSLVPGRTYNARFLARQLGGQPVDVIGVRLHNGVTADSPGSATAWDYIDQSLAAGAGGELFADVGHFSMQIGAAAIMGVAFVALYDSTLTPNEGDPGGLARRVYNYTSADADVEYQGETYLGGKASRIRRLEAFRPGLAERSRSEVPIAVPRGHPIAALARGVRSAPIQVTVYTLHRSDLTDARTPLQGEVADCRDEGASCILTLAGKGARLERKLPILATHVECAATLYDGRCRVSETAFQFTGGVVSAIEAATEGVIVTVDGAAAFTRPVDDPDPDSYFERGTLETPDGFKVTIEAVDADNGDRLTLPFLPPGLAIGTAVILSAGCDRSAAVCHGRFGNLANHLGEFTIPLENPFGPAGLVAG